MLNLLVALTIVVAFAINPVLGVILFVVIIGAIVVGKNKRSGNNAGTESLLKGFWIALIEMAVATGIAIKQATDISKTRREFKRKLRRVVKQVKKV